MTTPFVLWITGRPASGKSALAAALLSRLRKRGVDPVLLEFDTFRKYFLTGAAPSEQDRERFYQGIVDVASKFVDRGLPVLIDAAGNRREYRTAARNRFPAFAEIFVDCPLEICRERDTRGLLAHRPDAADGYEAPLHPELHLRTDREDPEEGARKVVDFLVSSSWIPSRRLYKV
jgi:adenylylsulfate kinase-like enzyme